MRIMILVSVFAVYTALSAAAGFEFSSDGWEGRLFRNEATGEFEVCMISTNNPAGNSLDIVVIVNPKIGSGALDLAIMARNPSWHLTDGRTYPSRIWIDEELLGLGGATADDLGSAFARISYSTRTFRKLKQGSQLKFRVAKKDIFFSLNGVAPAVLWLEGCARQGIAEGIPTQKGSTAPLPETGKLTLNNINGILAEAGLTGYRLKPVEQENGQAGGIWEWGRGVGIQFYGEKTGDSFNAIFADTVEHFKSACIETSSAFREVVTTFENGIAYGRSRFNCVNDQGKIRYAIIAVDDGRDVMVIVQFSEISRDVDEAYSRILSVLEEMFR